MPKISRFYEAEIALPCGCRYDGEKMARDFRVNQTELADYLDIATRTAQALKARGVFTVTRDGLYDLKLNVRAYVHYQREQNKNMQGSPTEKWRTRKVAADAQRSELQLKELKGELHRGEDILAVLTLRLGETRAQLLGIPSRCAGQLVGETSRQKIHDTLTSEIETGLRRVSELRGDDFERQSRKRLRAIARDNGKQNE